VVARRERTTMNGQMKLDVPLGRHDYLALPRGDVRFNIAENVAGLTLDQLDALARWLEDWEEDVAQEAIENYDTTDDMNEAERMGHDRGWDDAMSKAEDMIEVLFDDLMEAVDADGEGDDTYDALHSRIVEIIESKKYRLETL
jgi:ketosteroid isomerase-like protein